MAKSKDKKKKTIAEEELNPDTTMAEKFKPVDVKIKGISEKSELTSPIIGYFPSGYDPRSKSSVKVYRSVNSRNPKNPRLQVVVGASGSQVNFVGTNYSGEATTPQLCNYALGVLDKEKGVLKVVPIAANRIFRLEPKVQLMEPENEQPDEGNEELAVEEKADKFRNLTIMYSTKRDIRRDEKRETLRQTEGPEVQKDMDQKLKGVTINKQALEDIVSSANARNIPPYDLEATAADKAYPLDKIILKGEWDYLQDIFDLTQAESEANHDVYPSFVCNRVDKVKAFKDESKKRRMAGILSFITHLIRFKDRHSMDGVTSAKRHKLPTILSQKFSTMFGSSDKKRIPDEKQKLLISYVLVLSLFADNFRSDPSDIAKDLRINPLTLRTHYEYLGCKFVRENHVLFATLPVPLEFQTIKRKRKR